MSAPHFGSGGWRGRSGDEVSALGLRAIGRAINGWRQRNGPLLMAHDDRALGARMLGWVAEEISGPVLRLQSPVPTPVLTWALAQGHGCAGIQITASHNPASDSGVKVFGTGGVALGGHEARELERQTRHFVAELEREECRAQSSAGRESPRWQADLEYRQALAGVFGLPRRAPRFVYDAMHGAGRVVLPKLLRDAGAGVTSLRATSDPRFGGSVPDPRPEALVALRRRARSDGCVGFATDGDADRFALVDESGATCREDEALALLIDFLARERGLRGSVALSRGVGSLPEWVAQQHGLSVLRTAVGFHHGGRLLHAGKVDLAGDESGGFGWRSFSNDKDGILACALFAELASHPAGIRGARRHLRRRFKGSVWGRDALPATPVRLARLASLVREPPGKVGGASVLSVSGEDGVRLTLPGGFLMLRASQTEGLIRVYAEAGDAQGLANRFRAALRLLDAARRSR